MAHTRSYAHWKAAWLSFRQGRIEDARKGFENQIALYPDSPKFPPRFTGAEGWPKKKTIPAWPALSTRNSPTVFIIITTRSWDGNA